MNIDFTYHLLLAALVVPLGLIFHVWMAKGHPVTLPFDNSKAKRGRSLRSFVSLASCLPAACLAVVILLLSNPTRNGIPKDVRQMKNVLFCVDISGSMIASIGNGQDRFAGAMQAMNDFTNYREGDSFGLTVFGSEFWHWIPVTEDTGTLKYAEQFLHPLKIPKWMAGSTKIGQALLGCQEELIKKKEGDRMIVLISDGSSQDLRGAVPSKIAAGLKKDGIVVYAIHIGNNNPPASLRTITTGTGGEVFTATSKRALEKVFKTIDEMEKAQYKQTAPMPVDHMYPFALAGLCFLGFYVLTLFGLRFTPW